MLSYCSDYFYRVVHRSNWLVNTGFVYLYWLFDSLPFCLFLYRLSFRYIKERLGFPVVSLCHNFTRLPRRRDPTNIRLFTLFLNTRTHHNPWIVGDISVQWFRFKKRSLVWDLIVKGRRNRPFYKPWYFKISWVLDPLTFIFLS